MLTIYNLSSRFLELMAGASVRALCLAAVAGVVLLLIRRRSASMQHAAWTAVLVSMLVLPLVSLVVPPLLVPTFPQLRLSKESPTPNRITSTRPIVIDFSNGTVMNPRSARVSYEPTVLDVAVGLYLLVVIYFFVRLILGVALTNRMVRGGTTLRESEANAALEEVALQQSAKYPLPELLECEDVTVPCVVGAERQAILLPTLWRSWDAWKLRAVLAHELTHVRRGDWNFTLLAAFNKCIFWFHPLAWWLERRLATLAEQASDEGSVLLTRDPARYASILLEVSAAVSPSGGRYMAGGIPTVPMASAHPVARRIHRILDSPALSSGVFPARNWVMVVACAIPFLGAIAAARPQDVPRPTRPSSLRTANATAWINDGFKTTAAEAQQLEEQLARQTGDLEVRAKLISYYLYNAMQEPLAKHVLWVIEHQPDSELASSHPVSQPFSYSGDKHFAEKKALWLQQATVHNNNPRILANAATFLQQIDPPTAERLWKRAYQMEPAEPRWQSHLAAFYARVVEADSYFQVGVNVLRLWPESNPSYPAQVVAELERSSDAAMIGHVGTNIASRLRGSFYGGGTAFDAFQARRSMADRAESFLRRAQAQDPGNAMWTNGFTVLEAARKQDVDMKMPPPRPPAAPELPPSTSGDRVKVGGQVQERKLIQGEQPAYPALARQARLQGVVRLDVVIGVDGNPAHLQVRAGHPLLVPAAVEAVRKWRYEPTLLNGRPVEVETVVDVNFTLGQ